MSTWKIDPAHTAIEFKAKHLMIATVRGSFEKFDGVVEFNPENPAETKVDITIDAASLNTGVGDRDAHLRSNDFLAADEYPNLTFKSNRVEVIDANTAKLYGDLTIRDVSKEVALNVEFAGLSQSPWGTTNAGFTASTKINRKDWGLNWNVALETGGWLVSEEVTITIDLELIKVVEPAAEEAAAN